MRFVLTVSRLATLALVLSGATHLNIFKAINSPNVHIVSTANSINFETDFSFETYCSDLMEVWEGLYLFEQNQCEALKSLYTHTGGSDSWFSSTWFTSLSPFCTTFAPWHGVECSVHPGYYANVVGLNLRNKNLVGTLPSELSDLEWLQDVDISDNPLLTGPLPASLTTLTLNSLRFYGTNLCEPQDVEFQTWLQNIRLVISSGIPCARPTSSRITGELVSNSTEIISGFAINIDADNYALVHASSKYTITNLLAGTYILTPTLDGYTFLPPTRTVTVPPDATNIDFIACGGQQLAERYAPLLHFQQDDLYRPIHPAQAMPYVKRLQDKTSNVTAYPVTLDLLAQPQWRTNANAYINLLGDGAADTYNFYNRTLKAQEAPLILARIYCDDGVTTRNLPGKTAIQYWMFYYYDDWTNNHEGDWEMVQVILDENETPLYVAYSQHLPTPLIFEGGSKRPWQYVETVGNNRPKVYIANGSHASFFKPYTYDYATGDDITTPLSGDSPVNPQVAMLPVTPGKDTWVYFQGRWGDESLLPCGISGACGAPGPYPRAEAWHYQWDDPLHWAEVVPWDEDASQNSDKLKLSVRWPFDIELEDLETGNVVNYQVSQIPSAEYIDNSFSQRRTIIVHELSDLVNLPNVRYIFHGNRRTTTTQTAALAIGIDASSFSAANTIEITIPDPQAGNVRQLTFTLPATWRAASEASFSPSSSGGLNLQVDLDGNGTVDQQVSPTIQEETHDFTPPATITDLRVNRSASNTYVLEWTATGDDGSSGAAQQYDIRYGTSPLTVANWQDAWVITQTITPSVAGTAQRLSIPNLPQQGNHYFAINVFDDRIQPSGLSNIVGVITYPLNNQSTKYTLLTMPFAASILSNAASLATYIGNVSALLKWNPATQSFRFFAPPSAGDNFAIAPGDALFVLVKSGGPSSVTFAGTVTANQYALTRGGYNFLALPLHRTDLTTAAGVAADIGGVQALLSWNAASQSFRFFAPPASGDNFAVAPGQPFIALIAANGPGLWPADPSIVTQIDGKESVVATD